MQGRQRHHAFPPVPTGSAKPRTPRETPGYRSCSWAIDRRTFLKVAGGAGGALALTPLLARLSGQAVRAQAPATPPDVTGTVEELVFDQEQIFRFVADEVGYDPYAGALRGVSGTLWSRAGNSVDQALLLAALLDEALIPYRFVEGTLDEATAATLLAASATSVEEGRARAASTLLPPDVATAWTGAGPWLRAPEMDGLFVQARDQVDRSVEAMTGALGAAGIAAPDAVPALPALERDRHVWLQVSAGPDWIDLDPSIPGAQAGVAYATGATPLDTLPEDLHHRLVIRVDVETIQGGVPIRTEALRHEVRAADLAGVPITLVHPNPEWLGVGSALSGEQVYEPTLLVGDAIATGTRLRFGTGGGISDAFGEPSDTEGHATAEWLVVEIATPDGGSRTAERLLFDRIGEDVRAAGAFDATTLAPIELVDAGEGFGKVYLPLAGLLALGVTSHLVPWQTFADTSEESSEIDLASQVTQGYAHLRDLLGLEAVADRAIPRLFADEPGVTAFRLVPLARTPDGRSNLSMEVDLLHAHHAWAPFSDGDIPVPAGIVAGALDHAAERMVLEGTMSIVPDPPEQLSFVSVGRLLELAAAQGTGLVAVRPGEEARIPASPEAQRRIADALAAGLIVVTPTQPITVDGAERLGWWEIDPATGLARDRLDTGGGAELGEYLIFLHELATWAMCIVSLGAAVGAAVQGAWNGAMAWGAVAVGACIAAGGGGVPHIGH